MKKFLIIVFATFFPILIQAQNVEHILSKIPDSDKKNLTNLFYELVNYDNFGYTLFGDKPVSFSCNYYITPCDNLLAGFKVGSRFWKKWEVWRKYKNIFEIKKYLFIEEPSIFCENTTNIFFINKDSFINKVNHHLKLFREILGQDLTADKLLSRIEKSGKFLYNINNNEILFGILLGYGLNNATLYNKRITLSQFIDSDELPKMPIKIPSPSSGFSSIEEEYDFLNSKGTYFGEYGYSPLMIRSLNFCAEKDHPETEYLRKKYAILRGKISAVYSNGDFLEITLRQLTSSL